MGLTKTEAFTEEQNKLAALLKSLAHPARVAIIEHLLSTNSCITGDIVEVLPLAQATVSQHLRELKNADIIQGTVEGTSVCYCINPDTWNELKLVFNHLLERYPNDNCC